METDVKDQWRCRECETLLGVDDQSQLSLRYKDVEYLLIGSDFVVMNACRNCGSINERRSGRSEEIRA